MRQYEKLELTVAFTPNPDGWYTSQILEHPGAISQGKTKAEARWNVLNALSLILEAKDRFGE